MLSTTTAVQEQPADSIEKEPPNNFKNNQNSIANVAVDDDAQSFETRRENNYSVISLGAQVFIGTRLFPAQDVHFSFILIYVAKKSHFVGIKPQLKKELLEVCVLCKTILPGLKGRMSILR